MDKLNISNYVPVSISVGFYKIYVKYMYVQVMYKRVMHYLNPNDISVEEHFGFKEDISINKATYTLNHKLLQALSSKGK
jgi:hypothetical protein